LFPAGLSISRFSQALNQWQPDFGGPVDRNNKLIHMGTNIDLYMGALGVPTNKMRRERKLIAQIMALRDRQKEFRRQYAVAMSNYDEEAMMQLQAKYMDTFKGLGPLNVTRRDLMNYQVMSRIPRIQRIVNNIGSLRPMLEQQLISLDTGMLNPAAVGRNPTDTAVIFERQGILEGTP
jgi:metal-responsive CopG/Arc/MetJ family transcriptional regulator